MENNPSIKVEAYGPQIARANLLVAYGQFDPALTFNRSYVRDYSYPDFSEPLPLELNETNNYGLALKGVLPTGTAYSVGSTAENDVGPFDKFTNNYATFAGFNITQPLLRGFGFGANLVNVRVARANRSISEWQYGQTLIDTVSDVIDAYSQLLLAHDDLRIAVSSRDLAMTLLDDNQLRLKAGDMSQSDVTTAQAQAATREEAIITARNAVRSMDNELRALLGEKSFPADRPLLVVEAAPPPAVTVDPAGDYQKALVMRPDYQAARLGITINRAQAAAARNQLLPQVNLVASYGYNGLAPEFAASRHMAATGNFPSSAIGISVSMPITDAQGRGAAQAARLQLEQAETALARLEAAIAVDVANAGALIETERERVSADRAAYQLAQKALDDEVKKLREGHSTTLSVIQAQETLIEVENSVASAESAQRQAAVAYDRAVGTTLTRYHIDLAGR